ncbi:MAG: ADP-ribosylglycohydrolase family protein [Kiritimatiellia bacterium]|uniref:ADP-ribosylglycohydrolase family protein n=1 Tax=Atribacter sp. TaxID=2847780 RepID=UPI003D97B623
MKKLDFATYKDKVAGCWAGKNIGGVLGGPFEGRRQMNDADFYVQDLSKGPPANDDLDLQIVWLAAVEKFGRQVNAAILGEYWLSFVIPHWVEYGTGKSNMRAGLLPPITGHFDNVYRNSCGCFIRSEIWACLAPGHPEIAARYAFEDASVDHSEEGAYGEVFFAALQSAAFVESDCRKLIDIGLSYIPEGSSLARAIGEAIRCYDEGVPLKEARTRIHNAAPGTFGIQGCKLSDIQESPDDFAIGEPGFDAPENCAYAIAGWLYGEGDFGKSICMANACGEDTDCTCATLGATLGIISGASGLPAKWTEPLDDQIVTVCIDRTAGLWVPRTTTELTDRVVRTTPLFLGRELCDILAPDGYVINCREGAELFSEDLTKAYLPGINGGGKDRRPSMPALCADTPFAVRHSFPAFTVRVDYEGSVFYGKDEPRGITVTVENSNLTCQQHWARITLFTPPGVWMVSPRVVTLPLNNVWGAKAETRFVFDASEYDGARLELALDVSLEGRHSSGTMKLLLFPG